MQYKKILEDYFYEHMDEILSSLNEIISIQSVADENSDVKPFGAGSRKALDWGMDFMKKIGMSVKDFDGYAVRGDFYDDDFPKLGILAHLDTVPAGDTDKWHYPPFALTFDNGILYGRGTIDDKGPAVATLWAAKAIRELNIPVGNFRLIFGGNEEGGCNDMSYYAEKEAFPKNVFTPDGSFPVLNCEKGMMHLNFSADFDDEQITQIGGGTVVNAIPDKCFVSYKGGEYNVLGKASHGSRPENGDNAITKFLSEYVKAGGTNKLLNNLNKLFPHGEFNGKSCGLGFSDDVSGMMTCALTVLKVQDNRLCGSIDIRFPINRTLDEVGGIIRKTLAEYGFKTDDFDGMDPHYVNKDSDFVKTLLSTYEEIKGEKGYCIAEGGITYVHEIDGGVAFGAEFPDENNNMHGADEHISMETFKMNLNMYANAIINVTALSN